MNDLLPAYKKVIARTSFCRLCWVAVPVAVLLTFTTGFTLVTCLASADARGQPGSQTGAGIRDETSSGTTIQGSLVERDRHASVSEQHISSHGDTSSLVARTSAVNNLSQVFNTSSSAGLDLSSQESSSERSRGKTWNPTGLQGFGNSETYGAAAPEGVAGARRLADVLDNKWTMRLSFTGLTRHRTYGLSRGAATLLGTKTSNKSRSSVALVPSGDPSGNCFSVKSAPPAQQCALSQDLCPMSQGIFNYMAIHYCHFSGRASLTVPVYVLLLLVVFYFLVDTAEEFFCPSLTTLSEILSLSPNTAGVTLLALGNGAPDLCSSLASFTRGDPQVAMGAILSAGTFVTSFVVGSVAFFMAPFPVHGPAFVRDAAMYALAVLGLLCLYFTRVVHLWQALGFIAYYMAFVIMVMILDHRDTQGLASCDEDEEALLQHTGQRHEASPSVAVASRISRAHLEPRSGIVQPLLLPSSPVDDSFSASSSGHSGGPETDLVAQVSARFSQLAPQHNPWTKILLFVLKCIRAAAFWARKGFGLVFNPLRWATVPLSYPLDGWATPLAILNILLCPAVFLWGLHATWDWDLQQGVGVGVSMPLWCPLYFSALLVGSFGWAAGDKWVHRFWPVLVAFFMSITWVGLLAKELLALLLTLGALLGVSDAILGVTVLAWGNSVGDLVTNVTMALSGQPMMAVAGCFAGPLFNLTLGLGIPVALKTALTFPEPWEFHDDPRLTLVFPFLIISVLGSLCVVPSTRFQITRTWGYFLLALYIFFVVTCLIVETVLSP